jgi:hypothetical protein
MKNKLSQLSKQILIILFALIAFSANTKAENPTKWILHSEQNGVQVYYRYENCDDNVNDIHQQMVILKFVNTTNQNLSVEWDLEAYYNDICTTCGKKDKEQHFSTQLSAGEIKIGNFENRATQKELLIFAKFTKMESKVKLTKFNLANMKISIL